MHKKELERMFISFLTNCHYTEISDARKTRILKMYKTEFEKFCDDVRNKKISLKNVKEK